MCAMILSSKLTAAKIFKKWVTTDGLPSIRKYGYYKMLDNPKNMFKIGNETDFHYKVVQYIKRFYPDVLINPGLGELQDTSIKRIDAYKKGYLEGSTDLIINNCHKIHNHFCMEFKTPTGNGILSEAQKELLQK